MRELRVAISLATPQYCVSPFFPSHPTHFVIDSASPLSSNDRSSPRQSLQGIESTSSWRSINPERLSMTKFFGFDGTKWIDESFGVSKEMRTATYLHLKECGLR